MNAHKRNTGIFFIVIPLTILISAFLFDEGIKIVQHKRLEHVTKTIIKDSFTYNVNDYYEKAKREYKNKKIDYDQLRVEYDYDTLYIYNVHTYVSFFGRIFNIKAYRTDVSIKGTLVGDEVVFEKVDTSTEEF
ncbi:MAG TPA: hypothetical protein GX713_03380 [Mollicutes bacterium]|nr:hypothetical protein [Mollicutes bacterium]